MIIAKSIKELYKAKKDLTGSIGFIPTMGALHNGHISLIRQAKDENKIVIVSIFINPTQFLEGEDFSTYPRKDLADIEICKMSKVDILFMPSIDSMYKKDELTIMAPAIAGYVLDGASRPKHFDGMLQIVMKLLNLTSATKAYFGKKDAQQLALIKQMVNHYFLDVEIVECEIIRECNGLAMSSRNSYLSPEDKIRALTIFQSLNLAISMIFKKELNTNVIKQEMKKILSKVDKIEYVEIVNRDFHSLESVELQQTIILVAVYIGDTRLIDNIWI